MFGCVECSGNVLRKKEGLSSRHRERERNGKRRPCLKKKGKKVKKKREGKEREVSRIVDDNLDDNPQGSKVYVYIIY